MRIGIDAHALGRPVSGNERFVANVARELRGQFDHEIVLYLSHPSAAPAWARDDARTRVRVVRPANPLWRILAGIPSAARRDDLDVWLAQYVASRRMPCPVVTVVHDVSFAEHPEWFSPAERRWMPRLIPATMRRAAAVVTVSAFSAGEIERIYNIRRDKITVAYGGVDPVFASPSEPTAPREEGTFLAVGTLQPRKNLEVLFRACERPPLREGRCLLLVAGTEGYRAHRIRESGTRRVRFLGHLPDEELAALMRQAVAVCYPSRYEGFGLPVLEAMASGTPVLAADIPVMREIADRAAVLLPAGDPDAWAAAMSRVASDRGLREDLIRRGRERASRFSWSRAAEAVLEALERAARR